MKFLIIQPWISYRGAETVSVNLCEALNKIGHESKIACLFIDKKRLPEKAMEIEYILPSRGWQVFLSKNRFAFFALGLPVLFFTIVRHISEFDILNPHNPPSLWVAQFVKLFTGKKIVWTVHNIFPLQFPFLVDQIIAPTKKIKKEVLRLYGRKAVTLYNAV